MKKASPGKRIGAYILDGLVMGLFSLILELIFVDPEFAMASNSLLDQLTNGVITFQEYSESISLLVDKMAPTRSIIMLVITVLYFVVLPIFWEKQTVGRLLTKIKVVKETTEPATFKDLLVRELFGQEILSSVVALLAGLGSIGVLLNTITSLVVGIVVIIGFFTMLGEKKTTLYDRISKTRVVLTKAKEVDVEVLDEKDVIDL